MRGLRLWLGLVVSIGLTISVTAVYADAGCCEQCGCRSSCRKVCRLVCETKMVPKVTYSCECEDFCVPGPSKRCSTACGCQDGCDGSCGHHGKPQWLPTCAEVRTRKKLVRHEELQPVKTYKWVVQYVCNDCDGRPNQQLPVAPTPPPQVTPTLGRAYTPRASAPFNEAATVAPVRVLPPIN